MTELGVASVVVTKATYVIIGALAVMFAVRWDLWRRLWFERVDPRPAALMRICFGIVILVTFLDLLAPHPPLDFSLARFLFTDEGLWLTDLARKNYGGDLRFLWDQEAGFQHWTDAFRALWGRFTILHIRSDPPFVFSVYAVLLVAVTMMILGVRTRIATLLTFVAAEMLYRYSPVFYTGGDTVIRVFLFLGVFTRWGEAYSIDAWRRRRRALLTDARHFVALRRIPAWPIRLMMLQLACIYCATGFLKSGETWSDGTALYYALNLDHFYRWPQTHAVTLAHHFGLLPLATHLVRWWEILFPVAVVGAAVRAYERDRRRGAWSEVGPLRRWVGYAAFAVGWVAFAYCLGLTAEHYLDDRSWLPPGRRLPVVTVAVTMAAVVAIVGYRALRERAPAAHAFVLDWGLGKRTWLGLGLAMHVGIDVAMNVGTFAEVMMSVYLAWSSGPEIDRAWKHLLRRPAAPGEGGRPERGRWTRWVLAPLDRLRFRVDGDPCRIHHHPDALSVRRAALLRAWDLGDRLRFEEDPGVASQALVFQRADGPRLQGDQAALALTRVLPGLFSLRVVAFVPGVGRLSRAILRQR